MMRAPQPLLVIGALCACSEPVQAPLPAASMSMGIDSTGGPRLRTHYLSARILDRSGEPVPGVTVSWQQSDPDGEIIVDEAETNHRGIARARWVMTGFPGRYTATATAGDGLSATASDSIAARRYKSMMSNDMVSCVTDFDDRLACWPSLVDTAVPLPVSPGLRYRMAVTPGDISSALCALAYDGTVWCIPSRNGWQKFLQPVQLSMVEGLPGPMRDISASWPDRWCGVGENGELWCWGTGLLGDGPQVTNGQPRKAPVPEGTTFRSLHLNLDTACAIDAEGTPWCWGRSLSGSLPGIPQGQIQESPIPVSLPAPVRKLRITYMDGVCAIDMNSRVICWGHPQTRGFPLFQSPGESPAYIPSAPPISDIETVRDGFLGLGQGGMIYAWGCSSWAHGPCTAAPITPTPVHSGLRASGLTSTFDASDGCVIRLGTGEIVCANAYEWFRGGESHTRRTYGIWSPPPIAGQ